MINGNYGMKKANPSDFSHKGKGIHIVKAKDLCISFNYLVVFKMTSIVNLRDKPMPRI